MTGKAWAFLVRGTDRGPELLVFRHPRGDIEIPKGTVERGEDPAICVVRELLEETGVEGRVVETLPLLESPPEWPERQLWHSYVLHCDAELPDAWDHVVQGNSGENGLIFQCHWIPLLGAAEVVHPLMREITDQASTCGWGNARLWDAKAREWDAHVGVDGDKNRRLNSDPVLWRLLGSVEGQRVLDAGCGTGYLSRKLAVAGADVVGVDASSAMVEVARDRAPDVDFRVDDLQVLDSCPDASFDAVVSNYVLMDLPELSAAIAQIARVLRPGGRLVAVTSHPCFPDIGEGYFVRNRRREAWGPFSTEFQFWHRPLRDYLQGFLSHGLAIEAFEEPVVPHDATIEPELLARYRRHPWSFAVRCRRGG